MVEERVALHRADQRAGLVLALTLPARLGIMEILEKILLEVPVSIELKITHDDWTTQTVGVVVITLEQPCIIRTGIVKHRQNLGANSAKTSLTSWYMNWFTPTM